jgi:hypothetical protein
MGSRATAGLLQRGGALQHLRLPGRPGSNQFFFSNTGDATLINAANFSNAETRPTRSSKCRCSPKSSCSSAPRSSSSGISAAPDGAVRLSQGRTYIRGTRGAGLRGQARQRHVLGRRRPRPSTAPGRCRTKISTPFIDDTAADGGRHRPDHAFTIPIEGHEFYVINLPGIGESYAYDCQTQEWAQWGSQNNVATEPGLLLAGTSAGHGSDTIYAGSYLNGQVYTVDPAFNLDGTYPKRVIVSAALWISGGVQRCNNLSLQCVRGVGNSAAPAPKAWMRLSNDGGNAFTSWFPAQIGPVGEYRYKATWRNLGLIQQPGILFEIAVSDPVQFVAEGCAMNEARV